VLLLPVSVSSKANLYPSSRLKHHFKLHQLMPANHFYGLVEKKDLLVETSMTFKEEEISKDTISFEEESSL
jgi:hypothetical protein